MSNPQGHRIKPEDDEVDKIDAENQDVAKIQAKIAGFERQLAHLTPEQWKDINASRKEITRDQWVASKKYRIAIGLLDREKKKLEKVRQLGSRLDCLQCDRAALWGLDFCTTCLMTELEESQGKLIQPFVPRAKGFMKERKKLQVRRDPLGDAELQELSHLPHDARTFCTGNRVSVGLMQVLLARLGQQSRYPLMQQYATKYGNYSQGDPMGLSTTATSRTDVEYGDHRDDTGSGEPGTEHQGGQSGSAGLDHHHTMSPQFHRPSSDAESAFLPLRGRSPMIDGQKKPHPTGTNSSRDIDSERELPPSRAQQNEFGSWNGYYEQTLLPGRISSKETEFETSNEVPEADDHSMSDHPPASSDAHTKARQKPNEDWVSEVLENILQMEMAARPASPRTVGFAVKEELEKRLQEDIMHGDHQEGRPISIPLLRALDAVLKNWEVPGSA